MRASECFCYSYPVSNLYAVVSTDFLLRSVSLPRKAPCRSNLGKNLPVINSLGFRFSKRYFISPTFLEFPFVRWRMEVVFLLHLKIFFHCFLAPIVAGGVIAVQVIVVPSGGSVFPSRLPPGSSFCVVLRLDQCV